MIKGTVHAANNRTLCNRKSVEFNVNYRCWTRMLNAFSSLPGTYSSSLVEIFRHVSGTYSCPFQTCFHDGEENDGRGVMGSDDDHEEKVNVCVHHEGMENDDGVVATYAWERVDALEHEASELELQ